LLIFERQDITLQEDLAVTMTAPGQYDTFDGTAVLPAGVPFDSYMLHFESTGTKESKRVQGQMRFDEPVVAIIAAGEQLSATDDSLGHPAVTYAPHTGAGRGLEPTGMPRNADFVWLSEDRRSVRFQFNAPVVDQMRILVQPTETDDAIRRDDSQEESGKHDPL
jgi:hypothetical protein